VALNSSATVFVRQFEHRADPVLDTRRQPYRTTTSCSVTTPSTIVNARKSGFS
jgi:hypothetical protein